MNKVLYQSNNKDTDNQNISINKNIFGKDNVFYLKSVPSSRLINNGRGKQRIMTI